MNNKLLDSVSNVAYARNELVDFTNSDKRDSAATYDEYVLQLVKSVDVLLAQLTK
jgi:hypothetical protein